VEQPSTGSGQAIAQSNTIEYTSPPSTGIVEDSPQSAAVECMEQPGEYSTQSTAVGEDSPQSAAVKCMEQPGEYSTQSTAVGEDSPQSAAVECMEQADEYSQQSVELHLHTCVLMHTLSYCKVFVCTGSKISAKQQVGESGRSTDDERAAVERQLGHRVHLRRVPVKAECQKCIDSEPVPAGKHWRKVKDLIYDVCQIQKAI